MSETEYTPQEEAGHKPQKTTFQPSPGAATGDPNQSPSYFSHALRTGLFVGLLSMLISVITYVWDEASMFDRFSAVNLVALLLTLGICIFLGRQYVHQRPYFQYGSAYKYAFVALYLSGLIGTIWSILLFHVIDPELPDRLLDLQIEEMYEAMGDGPEAEAAIETSMKFMRFFFSPWGLLAAGALGGAMSAAFFSLFAALGIRKSPPKELL